MFNVPATYFRDVSPYRGPNTTASTRKQDPGVVIKIQISPTRARNHHNEKSQSYNKQSCNQFSNQSQVKKAAHAENQRAPWCQPETKYTNKLNEDSFIDTLHKPVYNGKLVQQKALDPREWTNQGAAQHNTVSQGYHKKVPRYSSASQPTYRVSPKPNSARAVSSAEFSYDRETKTRSAMPGYPPPYKGKDHEYDSMKKKDPMLNFNLGDYMLPGQPKQESISPYKEKLATDLGACYSESDSDTLSMKVERGVYRAMRPLMLEVCGQFNDIKQQIVKPAQQRKTKGSQYDIQADSSQGALAPSASSQRTHSSGKYSSNLSPSRAVVPYASQSGRMYTSPATKAIPLPGQTSVPAIQYENSPKSLSSCSKPSARGKQISTAQPMDWTEKYTSTFRTDSGIRENMINLDTTATSTQSRVTKDWADIYTSTYMTDSQENSKPLNMNKLKTYSGPSCSRVSPNKAQEFTSPKQTTEQPLFMQQVNPTTSKMTRKTPEPVHPQADSRNYASWAVEQPSIVRRGIVYTDDAAMVNDPVAYTDHRIMAAEALQLTRDLSDENIPSPPAIASEIDVRHKSGGPGTNEFLFSGAERSPTRWRGKSEDATMKLLNSEIQSMYKNSWGSHTVNKTS